jgi:DNA invertase Pin-like site-specific DNA recombinase
LKKLAKAKGLTIVREYVDVVESAKTEFRPAFQP